MGTLPNFAYKHPLNPPPGNVQSISAISIYSNKLYFGDITLGTIMSVPMSVAVTPSGQPARCAVNTPGPAPTSKARPARSSGSHSASHAASAVWECACRV